MYRLPYRAMCSRETNRLPIAELHRRLQSQVPNIENGQMASVVPKDPKYFVYHGEAWEFGIQNSVRDHFKLVLVDGLNEKVLEQGEAEAITFVMGERPYAKFLGKGEQVGSFKYYCTSPETR